MDSLTDSKVPWIAALAAYGILLLASETELKPLAVVVAWGIAITVGIETFSGGSGVLSALSSGIPHIGNSNDTPAQPVNGAGPESPSTPTSRPTMSPN